MIPILVLATVAWTMLGIALCKIYSNDPKATEPRGFFKITTMVILLGPILGPLFIFCALGQWACRDNEDPNIKKLKEAETLLKEIARIQEGTPVAKKIADYFKNS